MHAKDGRATLATVAASAGVSVATVSKVLNGRSDVGPETRARVEFVLQQHDYVGRRPAPPKDNTATAKVEVLFAGNLNAYSIELIQGLLDTARGARRRHRVQRAAPGTATLRGGQLQRMVARPGVRRATGGHRGDRRSDGRRT